MKVVLYRPCMTKDKMLKAAKLAKESLKEIKDEI